jgi:TolB protein
MSESDGCVDRAAFTGSDELEDGAPAWSPDGRQIAFHSNRGGEHAICTIDVETTIGVQPWLVDPESGEEKPLVDMPGSSPEWSPDGEWLVFERQERSGWFLSLVRPDGTGLRQLTAPR